MKFLSLEALTNVARHSGATEAGMTLEAAGDYYTATVEDNGKGGLGFFAIANRVGGFEEHPGLRDHCGLTIMRERAQKIGGRLEVVNLPQDGFRVRLSNLSRLATDVSQMDTALSSIGTAPRLRGAQRRRFGGGTETALDSHPGDNPTAPIGATTKNGGAEMSLDRYVLKSLLMIEQPWTVQDYSFDPRRRTLEVVVGRDPGRNWFGFARGQEEHTEERFWRHVNLAGWHSHVRLRLPVGSQLPEAPWCGDDQHPFTRGLATRVFVLFNEGLTLRSICSVLELPLDEVWKYRCALDSGRTGAAAVADNVAPVTTKSAPLAAQQALHEDSQNRDGIPDPSEPVWLALIEGRIELDVRMLSLKLLLTRVRTQLEVIRDDEVRMMKLRDVHRYFVKNERTLTYELDQIRKH